jgi:hypothetical protein
VSESDYECSIIRRPWPTGGGGCCAIVGKNNWQWSFCRPSVVYTLGHIVICIFLLSYEQTLVFPHSLHIIRVCVCLLFIENNLINQILVLVVVGSKYSDGK